MEDKKPRLNPVLRKVLLAILIIVFIILLLPFVLIAFDYTPPLFAVNGKSFGLLKTDDAREALRDYLSKKNEKPLRFSIDGRSVLVKPEEAGVTISIDKTLEHFDKVFNERQLFKKYLSYLKGFFTRLEVPVVFSADKKLLTAITKKFNENFGRLPVDAEVYFDDSGNPVYKKEKEGLCIAAEVVEKSAKEALLYGKVQTLKKEVCLPEVLLQDVKQLVEDQLPVFLQKKLILLTDDVEEEVSSNALKKILISGKVNGKLTFVIDPEKFKKELDPFFKKIEVKPVNASFDVASGKVVIKPDKPGYEVDVEKTAEKASRELQQSNLAQVELELKPIQADITYEEAKGFGIVELVSTFSTEYNPNQTARVTNIKLLAKLLDGQLIAPGEVFSFNERIGPRTLERGFKLAPTIINGKLVDTAGGGACQVGTTLFNTAFFAGVKIVERHNHSFYISHYPPGRDATVSYGSYDLKFKNDYQSWLLIKANATSSKITISFYGTKEGRQVKFETIGPYDIKPFSTEVVKDPALLEGKRVIEDRGISGRKYKVIRYVYTVDGSLLYKDTFFSTYRPKSEIVRIGTKKITPTNESTPTTTTL